MRNHVRSSIYVEMRKGDAMLGKPSMFPPFWPKSSECNQEIEQSHTADQPMTSQVRATEQ